MNMVTTPVVPASPVSPPESAPLSEGARILNTFVAPSKTFTDLRRNASWWAPFLLLIAVGVVFGYGVQQKIGFAKTAENVLETRPKQWDRIQSMKPDERENVMQKAEKQTMFFTYAGPVINLIFLLIIAGILLATFKFVANANVPYKVALAIVMYATLPGVVRYLLATVTLFAGVSPDAFNIQNPIATNLGFLFSPTDNPVLYRLGSMIDIFMFWTLALAAIGFTCVSKTKRGTALGIVFGWYVAFMVIVVGFTAFFA
jgi:hypothetical protein